MPAPKCQACGRYLNQKSDLEDLRMNRPPLGKTAYRQRVRSVLRTRKAQRVAAQKFSGFKGVCKEVVLKNGAASRQ